MATKPADAARRDQREGGAGPGSPSNVTDDLRIARDARHELCLDERVGGADIGVVVEAGTVRLTGIVQCLARKIAARQAVERVTGVRAVANHLEVQIPDDQHRGDAELARSVRREIESTPGGWRIRTTVCDGWVTLEGRVDRMQERDAAGRTVARLTGVTGITNDIVVG